MGETRKLGCLRPDEDMMVSEELQRAMDVMSAQMSIVNFKKLTTRQMYFTSVQSQIMFVEYVVDVERKSKMCINA